MEKYITTPLRKEIIATLKAGDYVYITGKIYTARDAAHKRMDEALRIKDKLEKYNAIDELKEEVTNTFVEEKIIADGMIPKITNALQAVDKGVSKVIIKNANDLLSDK